MSTMTVRDASRAAAHSSWVERAGRLGLVAKAASCALIGVLAVQVAIGQGGKAADRQGVLRHLATESWGEAALIALVVGLRPTRSGGSPARSPTGATRAPTPRG